MFTDEPTVKKFVDGFFKSHKTVSTESDVCIPPKKWSCNLAGLVLLYSWRFERFELVWYWKWKLTEYLFHSFLYYKSFINLPVLCKLYGLNPWPLQSSVLWKFILHYTCGHWSVFNLLEIISTIYVHQMLCKVFTVYCSSDETLIILKCIFYK
jgi:hypothetical protein